MSEQIQWEDADTSLVRITRVENTEFQYTDKTTGRFLNVNCTDEGIIMDLYQTDSNGGDLLVATSSVMWDALMRRMGIISAYEYRG